MANNVISEGHTWTFGALSIRTNPSNVPRWNDTRKPTIINVDVWCVSASRTPQATQQC